MLKKVLVVLGMVLMISTSAFAYEESQVIYDEDLILKSISVTENTNFSSESEYLPTKLIISAETESGREVSFDKDHVMVGDENVLSLLILGELDNEVYGFKNVLDFHDGLPFVKVGDIENGTFIPDYDNFEVELTLKKYRYNLFDRVIVRVIAGYWPKNFDDESLVLRNK